MAQTKKELSSGNFLIIFTLISLLVVGISGVVGKLLVSSIIRNTKVVGAVSTADKQLSDDLTNAPQLVNAYAAMGAQATTLSDALPNDADFPGLLVSMQNMAAAAGLTLKTVAPTQLTTDATTGATSAAGVPTPQIYPFSVTFDGTYDTMQKFLAAIEASARPMRVVGLQLDGSGSALSGEIDIQTYYQDKAQLPFSTETIK